MSDSSDQKKREPSDKKSSHWQQLGEHAEDILNVRVEMAKRQSRLADFADAVGRVLVNPKFFIIFIVFHIAWIAFNLPFVPWRPWDPYPFTLMATIASVEAPIIALLVLIHQDRQERVNEIRDELSLQIDLHIERKASMTLRLLDDLYGKMGYEIEEEHLEHLKEDLDPEELLEEMRAELKQAEGESDALL